MRVIRLTLMFIISRAAAQVELSPTKPLYRHQMAYCYGLTVDGGINDEGVIFSYNVATSTYTNLYSFLGGDSSGARPVGILIQAYNGLLYGTTVSGGINNEGVIFSFDPSTSTYANVYSFGQIPGQEAAGNLIQASNGLLYGLTYSNIPNPDSSIIFSYDLLTSTFTTCYEFQTNSPLGSYPNFCLMQASNGLIYGTTMAGGDDNYGVIFSFDPLIKPIAGFLALAVPQGKDHWAALYRLPTVCYMA